MPATLFPMASGEDGVTASSEKKKHSFVASENPVNEKINDVVTYLKQAALEGQQWKFNDVIMALTSTTTKDSVVVDWLKQMKDNILFLDRKNEKITAAVLEINWITRSHYVITEYHELILTLVSAHTYYLHSILNMVIDIFSTVVDEEQEEISEEENRRFQLAHKLLKGIISLVPMAPDPICEVVNEKFPYIRKPPHVFQCYAVNVLQVCTYLPSHRQTLLGDLIGKCLQIDVHCPRHSIQTCEVEKEDEDQQFQMDIDASQNRDAYSLADTLDVLMHSLFSFIESTCFDNSEKQLNWAATKKLFRDTLSAFDKLILRTQQCSHVQFIMMYICSFKTALSDTFLEYLWRKVKNPRLAPVQRQVATFYMSSLLARGLFVSIRTLMACLDLMCGWLHSYISNQDSKSNSDVRAHATFHCVCQTVFYTFAFRHKELIEMQNGFRYLRSLNLERIATCCLNPFRFCHPAVVQNFANVARNYQIAYCYPIIEKNNRSLLFGASQQDRCGLVKTFFPFDPYQLKRSKRWIEPIYRKYEDPDDSMDSDTEDDDDDVEEEEEDEESEHESQKQHLPSSALFSHDTSPGF